MTKRWMIAIAGLGLMLTVGCPRSGQEAAEIPAPAADSPAPAQPDAPAERPSMTSAECQAKGGTVVGDIGDGAIHRPDYRCQSGQPPIATIRSEGGGPVAVEGSVCCPAAAP